MQLTAKANSSANVSLWIGRILTTLIVLFMVFGTAIKVLNMGPAVEATTQLGYEASAVVGIGIVELICLVLYLYPRTAVLGAVLFTGYLGGAITTQILAGANLFTVVFPIIVGALLWGGLYLRDRKMRTFIPFRQ
jgi:hypothetical protein